MSQSGPVLAKDDEVYAPTDKGVRELKASAGTSLSAAELQVLVLVDGVSSLGEIAPSLPRMSREELTVNVRKLVANKFVVSATEPDSDVMGSGFSTISVPAGFFSGLADASATKGGVSFLKKKGFFVRIARRPAEQRKAAAGWQPTILVIDDDPDLQKLVRTYLSLEGFKMRAALKRDDIAIGLRQQPSPDMFLLDVQLPDTNGFEILGKIRQHPQLKETPVIMLTAETTREGVLRGLQGGADGYVTKPFEPDMLIMAIKTVLGIGAPSAQPRKDSAPSAQPKKDVAPSAQPKKDK